MCITLDNAIVLPLPSFQILQHWILEMVSLPFKTFWTWRNLKQNQCAIVNVLEHIIIVVVVVISPSVLRTLPSNFSVMSLSYHIIASKPTSNQMQLKARNDLDDQTQWLLWCGKRKVELLVPLLMLFY